ncbi:hypothetical protein HDV02_006197, partial [Globomyces sp. JEL0801]
KRQSTVEEQPTTSDITSNLDLAFNSIKAKRGVKYWQFLEEWNSFRNLVHSQNKTKKVTGGMRGYYLDTKQNSYLELQEEEKVPDEMLKEWKKQFQAMKTFATRVRRVETLRKECGFGIFFYHCTLPFCALFDADTESIITDLKDHDDYDLMKEASTKDLWPGVE